MVVFTSQTVTTQTALAATGRRGYGAAASASVSTGVLGISHVLLAEYEEELHFSTPYLSDLFSTFNSSELFPFPSRSSTLVFSFFTKSLTPAVEEHEHRS